MMESLDQTPSAEGKRKSSKVRLERLLKPFLERHPSSLLAERRGGLRIDSPWGDTSVTLVVSPTGKDLIAALNAVTLPARFSALWHLDSKDLEFIFTTLPIESALRKRSFTFVHEGKSYKCEFGDSSERLLVIAGASRPIGAPGSTDHRNLFQFWMHLHYAQEHPKSERLARERPTSFWIRNVEYEENAIVELGRQLNFYMSYFDVQTPRILIHEPEKPKGPAFKSPVRAQAAFPAQIRSKRLDPYLVGIWESALNAPDPFRRFIYHYQIIEYRAFYHVTEEVLRTIQRVVCAPDAVSRAKDGVREILESVVLEKMNDAQKFTMVIERCVDPAKLWEAIQQGKQSFAAEVAFEGGLALPALIRAEWTLDDFKAAWSPKFAESLRKIRNALVHSRESRMQGTIAPTRGNYYKLAPWLPLLRIAAAEVLLFGE